MVQEGGGSVTGEAGEGLKVKDGGEELGQTERQGGRRGVDGEGWRGI